MKSLLLRCLALILLNVYCFQAQSQTLAHSTFLPTRSNSSKNSSQHPRDAQTQEKQNQQNQAQPNNNATVDPQSAYNLRSSIRTINWRSVDNWNSVADINNTFLKIRDNRLYPDTEISNFLRRITWLYTDDGCFQRAAHTAIQMNELGLPHSKQLFVFSHITNNWVYHVAPVVRFNDEIFVFDPSLDYTRPLPIWEWLDLFTDSSGNVLASLCDETTWDPNGNCQKYSFDVPDKDEGKTLKQWREEFQVIERQSLGPDANNKLGDHPPWQVIRL